MPSLGEMDSVQVLRIEEFLNGKDFVVCERYHARLSKQACKRYRVRHPDACRGCTNRSHVRARGTWTREEILQALEDFARIQERPITVREFRDKFGLNFNTIKREWGSWKALCAAAGLQTKRSGRPNGRCASTGEPYDRQITVDLGGLPDLYEALNEEAHENGRGLDAQIICILKGWFT